jgi:hypothetical protein
LATPMSSLMRAIAETRIQTFSLSGFLYNLLNSKNAK